MLKQGTNFWLSVNFEGIDLDEVQKIKFVFCKNQEPGQKYEKMAEWVNDGTSKDAERAGNNNVIRVKWGSEETYMFPYSTPFFMDTKIYMKESFDNPATNIVRLTMSKTLFDRGD